MLAYIVHITVAFSLNRFLFESSNKSFSRLSKTLIGDASSYVNLLH